MRFVSDAKIPLIFSSMECRSRVLLAGDVLMSSCFRNASDSKSDDALIEINNQYKIALNL